MLLAQLVYNCAVCVRQSAEGELSQLDMDDVEMDQLRRQLADYFCEDVHTFQLDQCISTLNTFTLQFIAAVHVRSHCCIN